MPGHCVFWRAACFYQRVFGGSLAAQLYGVCHTAEPLCLRYSFCDFADQGIINACQKIIRQALIASAFFLSSVKAVGLSVEF